MRGALGVVVLLAAACGDEGESPDRDAAPLANDASHGEPDAGTGPPPPRVTFTALAGVFEDRCGLCHHVGGMGQSPVLRGDGVRERLVEVPSVEVPSMLLVSPGEPGESWLFHKIAGTHQDVCAARDIGPDQCGGRMPRGTSEVLTDAQVGDVRVWIEDGAR